MTKIKEKIQNFKIKNYLGDIEYIIITNYDEYIFSILKDDFKLYTINENYNYLINKLDKLNCIYKKGIKSEIKEEIIFYKKLLK